MIENGVASEYTFRNDKRNIYSYFLDNDQYMFCVRHGLSTNKSDYTDSELAAIKAKAIMEKIQSKENNRVKLNKILSE